MMNFAFELQKDKDWREGGLFQTFTIVSLWDVFQFHISGWINFFHLMGKLNGSSQLVALLPNEWTKRINSLNPLSLPADADDVFSGLPNELTDMELVVSAASAKDLVRIVRENPEITLGKLEPVIDKLVHTIKCELESRLLFITRTAHGKYYGAKDTFLGKEVMDKFSYLLGLREDAEEAGNCFAVGRYTACVFHLGRVVELCLQDFGVKTGISLKDVIHMQWQEIINKIRSKLNEVWPKHKDSNRLPYENMLGHLETVKNAWRSPTVHAKMTYTDEQAEDVINGVKAFVRAYGELLPYLQRFSA
jgi:hypothetical protein